MNDFLKKNLEVLLKRYPHFQSKIDAALKKNFSAEFDLSKKGELVEEKVITDSQDPKFFLEAFANINQKFPARIFIIEGFGLGEILNQAKLHKAKETKEYFIIEPYMERFLFACSQRDLRSEIQDPTHHWLVGWSAKEAYFEIFEIFKDFDRASRATATYFLKHPVLASIYSDYFQKFHEEWDKNFNTIRLFMGCPDDARLGLSNSIVNQSFVEENPGVDLLKNSFKGIPAIIVSTGPSLKRSIEDLKKVQNKAVLLAADASLNVLLKNGIVPHFVLSLEREGTTPFFQNLKFPNAALKSHLVAFPLVPPETLKAYDGPKWVSYRAYDYYSYFDAFLPKGMINAVHSVSHMCLGFAEHLGCSEVTFIGQDLSYDPETLASHPDGISYSEWSLSKTESELKKEAHARGEEMYWLQGNLHEKVPTSSYYLLYLQEFLIMFRKSKIKITNSTNGGVRLGETPWVPLLELAKKWPEHSDLFQRISEKEWLFGAAGRLDFTPARDELSKIHEKILNALDLTKKMSSAQNIQQLIKIKNDLLKERTFYAFVFVQMLRTIVGVEQKASLLFDEDERVFDKRQEILKEWFEEVEKATFKTLKIFETPMQGKAAV
ncbi:MAG: motility associated factor glycosyltransferase family protein [Deltaproteobacteria bacterium]|nr:motility associated factor glycosyltransferase family protein [Deltaproteobacteria bacterium]